MVSLAVMVSQPWLAAVSRPSLVSVAPLSSGTLNTRLSVSTLSNWSRTVSSICVAVLAITMRGSAVIELSFSGVRVK